jgi:hypothetical protein
MADDVHVRSSASLVPWKEGGELYDAVFIGELGAAEKVTVEIRFVAHARAVGDGEGAGINAC